jgi:membrane-bound metal-dependent hydrolase YbcI (DUF457 family)
MDPLSHGAFGFTVVRAVCPAVPRLAAAACAGALAPDIDAVFVPAGWDVYLKVHELGTHTLIGIAPVALAVAYGVRGRTRAPILPLFQAAWLAAASHLLLDVISGARIQLGWPLLPGRALVPLVAMAEPWVIALLVLGIGALAVFKYQIRRAAQCVLLIFALCLVVKGAWLVQALRTLRPETFGSMQARIVEAQWFSLREWNVFGRIDGQLMRVSIRPDREPRVVASWPIDSDSPLAVTSRQLDTVRNLLAVHELTFARLRPAADGTTEVLWSDVRFCWMPPSDQPAAPRGLLAIGTGSERIACALWFGGIYDDAGRAVSQRVQVFGVWQTRPAP